jgi:hypothetical protein
MTSRNSKAFKGQGIYFGPERECSFGPRRPSLAWKTRSYAGRAQGGYPEAPLFPNPSRPYTL